MTNATQSANDGYEDGFSGDTRQRFPTNRNYVSGYRMGSADAAQRRSHLRNTHRNR